jgi:hypothetical protein
VLNVEMSLWLLLALAVIACDAASNYLSFCIVFKNEGILQFQTRDHRHSHQCPFEKRPI